MPAVLSEAELWDHKLTVLSRVTEALAQDVLSIDCNDSVPCIEILGRIYPDGPRNLTVTIRYYLPKKGKR